MKVLWHSNAPFVPTGYGAQTAIMAPRLNQTHDVAISAFYGPQGASLRWEGMHIYPGVHDGYGNDIIQAHAQHHFGGDIKGGLVVSLLDVWVLDPNIWRNLNTCAWVPVDHDPAPPRVAAYFENSGAIPLAMSRFGMRMLEKYDPIYVPHGIPTDTFAPRDRGEARKRMGIGDDRFVVGMVAANQGSPSRKSLAESITAFAQFAKKRSDAHLYLHTEALGRNGGVNLLNLLGALEVDPQRVTFTDQYQYQVLPVSQEDMSYVYSGIDVLLNPARGEGFGIPVIEAQACGTPVIVTDFSAMSELGEVGWKVDGEKTWTYQESWQIVPRVSELVWALNDAHDRGSRLRGAAREFALQYDADRVVAEHFLPALDAVMERIEDRPKVLVP